MGPVFCLCWAPEDTDATNAVSTFEAELAVTGAWRSALTLAGLRLFNLDDRAPAVRVSRSKTSLVIGDVFDRMGRDAPADLGLPVGPPPGAIATFMQHHYWGRYLLVLRDEHGTFVGAFRDPSGAIDVSIWRKRGVTVVASQAPEILIRHFGPQRGLNWSAVHDFLADPIFGGAAALISGMATVAPGALTRPVGDDFAMHQLWRPADFTQLRASEAEIAGRLNCEVDLSVAAHAGRPGAILGEISGGFDSAVVAAALVKAKAPVAAWSNYYTEDPSGDERVYARAVSDHFGFKLQERLRPPFAVLPERIAESQFGLRPSAFALDLAYENETLKVARACGATRLFTGIGGDGLFFVSPYPAIARDLYLSEGVRGLASPAFGDLARWCRKSVWSMAGFAFRSHHPAPVSESAKWVAQRGQAEGAALHPWREGADGLPPAKQRHIDEQILVQLTAATSLRGRELDIVHPLLSQPVVEFCLSVPVPALVAGGRDRALARRAFASRLPDTIIERRSKGELGAYYSHAVAAAVPALRSYLLDGRLAMQGLLSRPALEEVLDPTYLAQAGTFSALLFTAAIEAWVRRWEPLAMGRFAL